MAKPKHVIVVAVDYSEPSELAFEKALAEGVARLAPCSVLVVRRKIVPSPTPVIEPPCPRCLTARRESKGDHWCDQHRERQGQRHVSHPSGAPT